MDGGPTHFETFDPKPDAPAEIRGEFTPIATKIPGVHFSQHMTRLAGIADKLAIVRSIRHNQGNHGAGNHYMMTGAPPRIPVGCGAFVSFHPSLGSVTAYERGAPEGLPAYFSMPSMSRSGGPNFLGAKYAPFVVADDPNSKNFRVRDVALPEGLTDDRFHTAPRSAATGRSLPADHRQGRRRSGRRRRRVLSPGLQPDDQPRGAAGVRHPPRAGQGPRRLRPQLVRPAGPARAAAGRGRRAVRHALRRRLGPSLRDLLAACPRSCRRSKTRSPR